MARYFVHYYLEDGRPSYRAVEDYDTLQAATEAADKELAENPRFVRYEVWGQKTTRLVTKAKAETARPAKPTE